MFTCTTLNQTLKDGYIKHYLHGVWYHKNNTFLQPSCHVSLALYPRRVMVKSSSSCHVSLVYLLIVIILFFELQILTDFLVRSIIVIFREIGLLTRSTARKRRSRELVMMCIQTARLQQLSTSYYCCLVIYQTLINLLGLFCFCLISAFSSLNQHLRMCQLFKVISLIHKMFIYIKSVYLGDWSSRFYTM